MVKKPATSWTTAALVTALTMMLARPIWAEPGAWSATPDFVARYQISLLGVQVGELTVSFTSDGNHIHELVAEVVAARPLQLLIPASSTLSSRLVAHNGQLRPLIFTRRTGKGTEATEDKSIFDWTAASVTTHSKDTTHSVPLNERTFDSASIYFAIMLDQSVGAASEDYSVWDGKRMRRYQTTAREVAAVDTALGTIETVLVERQRVGGKSLTRLWLAPDLHYLPVQVAHVKGKRERFRLSLASVTGLEPIPEKTRPDSPHP